MPRPTTIRGVLLAAARLIEQRGWTRDDYERDGRFCVMGAINHAVTGKADGTFSPLVNEARIRLSEHTSCGVLAWNSAPGRTKAEVLAALRRAAKGAGG